MATAEADLDFSDFGCAVSMVDNTTVVELSGELDLATSGQLRLCLTQPNVFDSINVRVDVTFLGSTGIGVLIAACKRARAVGGCFTVGGGSGMAQRVIEISGLVEYFSLQDISEQTQQAPERL